MPTKAEQMVSAIESTLPLVTTSFDAYLLKNGSISQSTALENWLKPSDPKKTTRVPFEETILKSFVIGACSLFRKSFVAKLELFPSAYLHDRWISLSAAYSDSLYCIPHPLIKYRIHQNQQIGLPYSSSQSSKQSRLQDRIKRLSQESLILSLLSELKMPSSFTHKKLAKYASLYFYNRALFLDAKKLYPPLWLHIGNLKLLFRLAKSQLNDFITILS